jgi:hypothetical protein
MNTNNELTYAAGTNRSPIIKRVAQIHENPIHMGRELLND